MSDLDRVHPFERSSDPALRWLGVDLLDTEALLCGKSRPRAHPPVGAIDASARVPSDLDRAADHCTPRLDDQRTGYRLYLDHTGLGFLDRTRVGDGADLGHLVLPSDVERQARVSVRTGSTDGGSPLVHELVAFSGLRGRDQRNLGHAIRSPRCGWRVARRRPE